MSLSVGAAAGLHRYRRLPPPRNHPPHPPGTQLGPEREGSLPGGVLRRGPLFVILEHAGLLGDAVDSRLAGYPPSGLSVGGWPAQVVLNKPYPLSPRPPRRLFARRRGLRAFTQRRRLTSAARRASIDRTPHICRDSRGVGIAGPTATTVVRGRCGYRPWWKVMAASLGWPASRTPCACRRRGAPPDGILRRCRIRPAGRF